MTEDTGRAPRKGRGITIVADDFGMSEAVSLGILDALADHRITGTSVMTNRPGWKLHARDLHGGALACDVGLHLNLTFGSALTCQSGLQWGTELAGPERLFRALIRREVPARALEQEVTAQIDAFEDHMGCSPHYIDGHHHVHAFPVVRDVLLDVVSRRSMERRIWLRDSSDRWLRILARRFALCHALTLALITREGARRARAIGIPTNDGFSGVSALSERQDMAAEFARFLIAPGPRHLLMVHPGRSETGAPQDDGLSMRRERELAFLLSPTWPEMLRAADLAPVRFQELEACWS